MDDIYFLIYLVREENVVFCKWVKAVTEVETMLLSTCYDNFEYLDLTEI